MSEAGETADDQRAKNIAITVAVIAGAVLYLLFMLGGWFSDSPSDSSGSATTAGLQQTLETRDGVAFRVTAVNYGVETPDTLLISDPLGEFATVTFRVANESSETLRFSTSRISALIEGAKYEPSGLASPEGEYLGFSERINPGLSLTMIAYFDIPPGVVLDGFEYDGLGSDSLQFDLTG